MRGSSRTTHSIRVRAGLVPYQLTLKLTTIMSLSRFIGIPADYKNPHNESRKRTGKTERDHRNGNARRNMERKAARAEWQKNNRATNATFPV